MAEDRNLRLRGARDRLVDLLKLGETAPLQDTEVLEERILVPVKGRATVPIAPGQVDVRYLLHRDGKPPPTGKGTIGTGGETLPRTAPLEDKGTYRVLARKEESGREAYLLDHATVEVGVDKTLRPRIDAPLLDQWTTEDTAPRIVDHGTAISVLMDRSQPGVDYRLIYISESGEEIDLSPTVRGHRDPITLTSVPIFEDTLVRVSVTKQLEPSDESKEAAEVLINAAGDPLELPLKVRPNRALPVAVEPSNDLNLGGEATIKISDSQASCSYQVYVATLTGRDFVFDDDLTEERAAGASTAETELGDLSVRVIVPPKPNGEPVEGFSAVGNAVVGIGGDLRLPVGGLTNDTLVLVEARKEHSNVWLTEAAIAFVKPDPEHRLGLQVVAAGTKMVGGVQLSGGQPGVYYYLRRGSSGKERTEPAFFHQSDEFDGRLNKGIGGDGEPGARRGVRVGVDLSVAGDPPDIAGAKGPPDRASDRPEPPVVELGPIPLASTLHVRAVRARSGASVAMTHSVPLFEPPEIRLDRAEVAAGNPARILVVASHPGDGYQLFLGGAAVRRARSGNGKDLVFVTDPIERPTTFELRVSRRTAGSDVIVVVQLRVGIQPTEDGP